MNSGNATQSQPTPHYAGATEHHPPGIPPPGYPAFPHPGMHSSPNAANANAQAAAAAAAMAAASAMGSPFGFHGMPFPQHYAAQARAPAGHYAADMYGRSRGDQQVMPPPPGHQMDPSVSFEHMMAYQASVEHSRSFAAFKRSREDPAMQMQMGMDGGEEDHAQALKRPRLVWTPPLHKRFVDAVAHLGIKNAVPKTIMQLMNVEGLTRENVASHLQKYRLYLKRLQGCSESTMENSPSREGGGSGGGSDGARPGGGSGGSGNGSGNGSGSEGDGDGGSGKGNGLSEKGSGAGNSGNGSGNGSDGEPGVNKAPGAAGPSGNSAGAGAKGINPPDAGAGGSGDGSGEGSGGEGGGSGGGGERRRKRRGKRRWHRASVVRGTRVLGRWVRGRRRRHGGRVEEAGTRGKILGRRRVQTRRREGTLSRRRRGARSRLPSSPRIRAALYVCTARGLAFGRVGSTRSRTFFTLVVLSVSTCSCFRRQSRKGK